MNKFKGNIKSVCINLKKNYLIQPTSSNKHLSKSFPYVGNEQIKITLRMFIKTLNNNHRYISKNKKNIYH